MSARILHQIEKAWKAVETAVGGKAKVTQRWPLSQWQTPEAIQAGRRFLDLLAGHCKLLNSMANDLGRRDGTNECLEIAQEWAAMSKAERSGSNEGGPLPLVAWLTMHCGFGEDQETDFVRDLRRWAEALGGRSFLVPWDDANRNFVDTLVAVALPNVAMSLPTVSKRLTPDGSKAAVRHMRKGQRCKVHLADFVAVFKANKPAKPGSGDVDTAPDYDKGFVEGYQKAKKQARKRE